MPYAIKDMTPLEVAHARVVELINRFEKYARDKYLQPGYQEAEARKDFIDPLMKALGWDVDHEREHNPYEQEVKVERGGEGCRARAKACRLRLLPHAQFPRCAFLRRGKETQRRPAAQR